MKHVVVITYRFHYHITQVAISTIIKQFNPDKITILFDDLPGMRNYWKEIGPRLAALLKSRYQLNISSKPFSLVPNIHSEISGWIRQQYVKLNLHNIFEDDEWVVVDGDAILNKPIDPWSYQYLNTRESSASSYPHHDIFTRYVLNLGDKRPVFQEREVEFSSMPVRLLTRKTLAGLEQYILNLHGANIRQIRDALTLKQNREYYIELSEWDLICNYQTYISKDLLPLKFIDMIEVPADELYKNWSNYQNEFVVLQGYDNLPKEWYESLGVAVDQEIWRILYETENLI